MTATLPDLSLGPPWRVLDLPVQEALLDAVLDGTATAAEQAYVRDCVPAHALVVRALQRMLKRWEA